MQSKLYQTEILICQVFMPIFRPVLCPSLQHLLYDYMVHLHCQWERQVIHTKLVYICFTQVYVYGIAYPFSIPFRVLVTPPPHPTC